MLSPRAGGSMSARSSRPPSAASIAPVYAASPRAQTQQPVASAPRATNPTSHSQQLRDREENFEQLQHQWTQLKLQRQQLPQQPLQQATPQSAQRQSLQSPQQVQYGQSPQQQMHSLRDSRAHLSARGTPSVLQHAQSSAPPSAAAARPVTPGSMHLIHSPSSSHIGDIPASLGRMLVPPSPRRRVPLEGGAALGLGMTPPGSSDYAPPPRRFQQTPAEDAEFALAGSVQFE